MKRFATVLLAVMVSGALFCAAIPPGVAGILGWICLVPALMAIRKRGFLVGFLGGLGIVFTCALIAESGVFYPVKSFSGNSAWLYAGCGLFGFSIAIACGIWAERGLSEKPAWWFAAIATLLESVLLLKLPAHMALSQWQSIGPLQVCSVGGIWLLSFLIWWANFAIARNFEERKWKPIAWATLLIVSLNIGSLFVPTGAKTDLTVSVLQIRELESDAIEAQHRQISATTPDLVVWPEFAGLAFGGTDPTERMRKFASEIGIAPFVTSFGDGASPMPHNTSAVFDSNGVSAFYFKRKPFASEVSMYAAGDRPVAVGSPHLVGLNICFDSCFNFVVRQTIAAGDVRFIALPSIDPEAPHGFIAANHAAFSAIRSAELGVPIAKADGYGYSCITDSYGRFLAIRPKGDGFVSAELTKPRWTFDRLIGDGFLAVCGALVLLGIWNRRTVVSSSIVINS